MTQEIAHNPAEELSFDELTAFIGSNLEMATGHLFKAFVWAARAGEFLSQLHERFPDGPPSDAEDQHSRWLLEYCGDAERLDEVMIKLHDADPGVFRRAFFAWAKEEIKEQTLESGAESVAATALATETSSEMNSI